MMDGSGTFWAHYRGANSQDDWTAWKGTNTGFDQSINSSTTADVPMSIVSSAVTAARAIVVWAQVRFYQAVSSPPAAVAYNYLPLLGVG